MTNQPAHRLSRDELLALKFAAHRQLARWVRKSAMSPRHRATRAALVTAVRTLEDQAFAKGCELRASSEE